mgnify:CR=1 FL=1
MGFAMNLTLPIRAVNTANTREHWARRAARAKQHRHEAYHSVRAAKPTRRVAYTVTLTRIGKRRTDSDGLAISLKAVRDGVADALGIDDGSERIAWLYGQEIGREYAVRIEIT